MDAAIPAMKPSGHARIAAVVAETPSGGDPCTER